MANRDLATIDFESICDEASHQALLRQLGEDGPVIWNDSLNGWMVTSYQDVRTVFSDMAHFTSEGTPIAESFAAEAMLVNDTPLHNDIRSVWSKAVSRPSIETQADSMQQKAALLIEAALSRMKAGEAVDFVPIFRDYVLAFIASGFAIPENQLDVFVRWHQQAADTPAVELKEGSPERQRHMDAKKEGYELINRQVDDRRKRLAAGEQLHDLTSLMVAAEGRGGITTGIVIDNLFNLVLGSFDTTEKWLGNCLLKLIGDPGLLEELRADRELVEPFVQEVMRHDTVAQVIQRRVRDGGALLGGKQMKGGDTVFTLLGAANRDPKEFSNPETFDIHRPFKANLAFGFGFHHCLGIHLARQETIAFVNALLDTNVKLRVIECDMGNSWALWGPRELTLALQGQT